MKKYILAGIAGCVLCCTALLACTRDGGVLTGIRFDRGHGSAWGNQFYIEVHPQQIAQLRYIPEESGELTVCENIPITGEQWQQLAEAVGALELKEKRNTWREALFGAARQDGGEYRTLTLLWERKSETKEITYQWPRSDQANALEALLEGLTEGS